jgi:hypothetical protein
MYTGPNPADWKGITRLVKIGDSEWGAEQAIRHWGPGRNQKFSDVHLPDQTPIWNDTTIANAAPRK